MFGGYLGQDDAKEKIKDLSAKLANDPNNEELREKLAEAKKSHQDRMDSALRSYSRL